MDEIFISLSDVHSIDRLFMPADQPVTTLNVFCFQEEEEDSEN